MKPIESNYKIELAPRKGDQKIGHRFIKCLKACRNKKCFKFSHRECGYCDRDHTKVCEHEGDEKC